MSHHAGRAHFQDHTEKRSFASRFLSPISKSCNAVLTILAMAPSNEEFNSFKSRQKVLIFLDSQILVYFNLQLINGHIAVEQRAARDDILPQQGGKFQLARLLLTL